MQNMAHKARQKAYANLVGKIDYAICKTEDGQRFEVITKVGETFGVLEDTFSNMDDAIGMATGWLLEQIEKEISEDR